MKFHQFSYLLRVLHSKKFQVNLLKNMNKFSWQRFTWLCIYILLPRNRVLWSYTSLSARSTTPSQHASSHSARSSTRPTAASTARLRSRGWLGWDLGWDSGSLSSGFDSGFPWTRPWDCTRWVVCCLLCLTFIGIPVHISLLSLVKKVL